ncbi:MAG: ribosome maturation factor RimM [Terriglobales bacterium]|jgi:16S rRNA processing protein RimM
MSDDFITLAWVRKTQGRIGEVAVEPQTDVPDRFHEGMHLWALAEDGKRRELQLEGFWPHKGQLVLKFAGVDSISDAEALLKCELQVPRSERAQLESGWTYVSDLVGCVVFDGDRSIGEVKDLQFGAGEAPLLIVRSGTKEYEIPYAEAYLRNLDLNGKKIFMQLPEGLLEVNGPLTAEEKQEQGRKQ